MLRHFRINDPYRLLSLLFLLVLTSLPFLINLPATTFQELKDMVVGEEIGDKLMYVEILDDTPPLMALTSGFLEFIFGRSLISRHILALIIIFLQASYFGILLINNKAYNDSNYLPSLIFGFLCFFSFDLLAMSSELVASCLLLLALNNIFKEIEFRVDRDSVVLNLGVFLGMASLFIFSYTIFLFGTIFILIIFARASLRKISLLLFGYGLVHAILITYYYWYGAVDELWANFYVANFTLTGVKLVTVRSIFILGSIPIAYFVFSLFMLTREAHFTRYQSQLFQVMFLWLATAVFQVWVTPALTPHSFFTFIPPLTYFISHYLLLINRKWIAEIMLWIFILGLPAMNLLTRYKALTRIDYSALFPQHTSQDPVIAGKKVMILGNDLSILEQNEMAGYFLNWKLSKKYFEEPDYYENLSKINKSFRQDPPEVIIDPENFMEAIIERIPMLKKNYYKEGSIYLLR